MSTQTRQTPDQVRFPVQLKTPFSRPSHQIMRQAGMASSSLAKGHRAAARSGLYEGMPACHARSKWALDQQHSIFSSEKKTLSSLSHLPRFLLLLANDKRVALTNLVNILTN